MGAVLNCLCEAWCKLRPGLELTRDFTMWRLSNFELAIETGRYTRPKTYREQRLCRTCLTVEDEYHVFFVCPLYNQVRTNHPDLFSHPYSVKRILNPNTRESVYKTAYVLFEIEKIHKKFNQ